MADIKTENSAGQDPEEENQEVIKPNQCTVCHVSFTRKTTLRRHMAKAHKHVIPPDRPHVLHKCLHADCTEQFKHITAMLEHLKDKHGDTIDETQYEFNSMDDFKQWKEMEETQNYVFFAKSGATVAGKHYFVCQRHGSQRAHRSTNEPGRKTPRRNKRGSVKTNTICPARMNVRIGDSGKVTVKYIYSHNHPVTLEDTEHQPLPASVREDIKTKLAMGVKDTDIMKNLREGCSAESENTMPNASPLKRKYFVTKQQLIGIKRHRYGRKRLDGDDAMSVTLKVTNLMKEMDSPILIYKAKGEAVSTFLPDIDTIERSEEVFCLGLQTNEQCKMLALYGEKLLVIDSVHAIDKCNYKLINLLVVDEFNQGYPVGHLLTTSMNMIVLKTFFKEIKRRVPTLRLSAVMTDDAKVCFDAVNEVFGSDGNMQHLLSRWHMLCMFRKQTRDNTTEVPNTDLYSRLIQLLDETNYDEFTITMLQLIKEFEHWCPKLAELLQNDFANRTQWATCCIDLPHIQSQMGTRVCSEVLSSRLREYYMQSNSLQRIDELIDLLLTVENITYWRHKGEIECSGRMPPKQQLSLHEAGLLIPDDIVTTVEANKTWRIASSPERFVTLVQEECTEDFCEEMCLDVRCIGLCQHLYLCTCRSKQSRVLCEHQHKVHCMRQMPNEINKAQTQAESQSDHQTDAHHHQSDHQSDHSTAGSDNQDDHQVGPNDQAHCYPLSVIHAETPLHSSHHSSDNDHQTGSGQTDHHAGHHQQNDHQVDPAGQIQNDPYHDESGEHHETHVHCTGHSDTQPVENVTTTATEDYEVIVFQGASSLRSSTQAETQQQVDGILSQMEFLRGQLENPKVASCFCHMCRRRLISWCLSASW
ncbi:uncharacterized protein [Amphiura filiformis]|uniref:uncharacterized protein isoform X2 n=1 Tax=Amphiura filiformis TaxID=82378 RepID=UPI003B210A85